MKKIVRFGSVEEFQAYRENKAKFLLGSGSEGCCYLGKDGFAYKDFTEGYYADNYDLDKVITVDDCTVSSFLFPQVLFAVGDELVGYTSDSVSSDLINNEKMIFEGIDDIDFDKFASSYDVFMADAIKLGEQGITIYDLPYNILFDGERLVAVDTCGYYYDGNEPVKHNINSVNEAIKLAFSLYVEYAYSHRVDMTMEVKPFLKMIEDKYTNHNSGKDIQYTKK